MAIDTIEFVASLPDIQSALSVSGNGAARVKLDVPESDVAQVLKLLLLRGQAFRVAVVPINEVPGE